MVHIKSTTYCDDPHCEGHVTEQDHPEMRLVLTDDPALPLALVPEEES